MMGLINKDGLPVSNNSKSIHEELFRGTGYVMGPGASIFIQNESITEKYIIVFDDKDGTSKKRFISGRFNEAQELFQHFLSITA